MKIKKYEGKTEQDAMQKVKDELGVTAIILSIKRKPHKGILAFFRSPAYVVTAAYNEKSSQDRFSESKAAVQKEAQSYLFMREQEREKERILQPE